MRATALVAFAISGGSPAASAAGNDSKVPPPAIELIAPAAAADATRNPSRARFMAAIVTAMSAVRRGRCPTKNPRPPYRPTYGILALRGSHHHGRCISWSVLLHGGPGSPVGG